ncbi:MAG: hypothetical protein ACREGL_08860 [Alphaproteobacteria bacterium]
MVNVATGPSVAILALALALAAGSGARANPKNLFSDNATSVVEIQVEDTRVSGGGPSGGASGVDPSSLASPAGHGLGAATLSIESGNVSVIAVSNQSNYIGGVSVGTGSGGAGYTTLPSGVGASSSQSSQ